MKLIPFCWLCALLLVPVASSVVVVQSKKDQAFGTAITRDHAGNRVLMIGTHYGNTDAACFVTVLDLESGASKQVPLKKPQVCTVGVLVNHGVNGIALLAGMDGDQAILQPVDDRETKPLPDLPFGNLPKNTIPVAMTNGEDSHVFVAVQAMGGNALSTPKADDLTSLTKYLNDLDAVSSSPPHVLEIDAFTGAVKFQLSLDVKDGKATIADLAVSGQYLIVVGSTNGSGRGIGNALSTKEDFDGFVGVFDPVTLQIETEPIRIDSGKNDFVNKVCLSEHGFVYIVGTTEGNIEGGSEAGGAFVLKIEIATGKIHWSRQYPGKNVEGLGCAVVQGPMCIADAGCSTVDHLLYIGGNSNGVLDEQHEEKQYLVGNPKSKNVFVSAVSPMDGKVIWTRELDSTKYFGEYREDNFASLIVNPDESVSVYFNSMADPAGKDIGNDVLFVSMNKNTGNNEFDVLVDNAPDTKEIENDNEIENDPNQIANDDYNKGIIIASATVLPFFFALIVFGWQILDPKTKAQEQDQVLPFQPKETNAEVGEFV